MIKQLIFGGACGCCCSQTSGYLKKSLKTLIIHTRDRVISGSRMVTLLRVKDILLSIGILNKLTCEIANPQRF